ncbi:MAG: hypothetical protein AABX52_03330 [Nanoarchaeota archaeon]
MASSTNNQYSSKNNRDINGIYWNNHALRVILEYLGAPGFSGLEPGLKKLSDSGNLHSYLLRVHPEGMVVCGQQIPRHPVSAERYDLRFPATLARDFRVPDAWKTIFHHSLGVEGPPLELNMQLWQREIRCLKNPLDTNYRGSFDHGRPTRAIFLVDVEYKNRSDDSEVIIRQERIFRSVQGVVKSIEGVLQHYGFSYLKVMTGKGYNLVGHIPEFEPIFNKVCSIGRSLEPTLEFFMKQVDRRHKRLHEVPSSMELCHKGLNRLMQFIVNKGIVDYRKHRGKVRLTTKAQGDGPQVIADEYLLAVEASMKGTGIPGCPYLRFWYQDWKESYSYLKAKVLPSTAIPIRLPLGYPGKDRLSIPESIRIRNNFHAAMEYLSESAGVIPNCSHGIMNVIQDYRKSAIGRIHQQMEEKPFIQMNLSKESRKLPSELVSILHSPDDKLNTGSGLAAFVGTLYHKAWHPKDIASLIATAYLSTPSKWHQYYSAHRRAAGETERVIGDIISGIRR